MDYNEALNVTARDLARGIEDQLPHSGGSLFWRWARNDGEPLPPRYGPPLPWWDFNDLTVEWVDADHRRFSTWVDWEQETVTLDRDQARELRDMLNDWLGD